MAWRPQAPKHDLELPILGPASPPTRLHDFEPPNLSTVRMAVDKDSSQPHLTRRPSAEGYDGSAMPARELVAARIRARDWL
jgi:hypothetical protein